MAISHFLRVAMLFCMVSGSGAWGPLSHYLFAWQAYNNSDWYHEASVKQGCDMPDAFLFSNFGEFPLCSIPAGWLHNPVTAGYFVKFAQTQNAATSTFSPLAFALAYGSHTISDIVGFFPSAGYLGASVQSWVTTFPFMTAIDALASSQVQPPASPWATADSSAFVVAAGKFIRGTISDFPAYATGDVDNCTMPWQVTQQRLTEIAALELKTGFYQSAMVLFDQFNATTFDQALASFRASNGCAIKAVQYWTASILDSDVTPEAAFNQTVTFVEQLFERGACTASESY
eukprot:TRINITY_DN2142_c0_g2_i1.p1 TRINITY_DN2142_c0_g2~~TRINITY_DN2142_c0_g2_i1.p1  ORF type:complete len:288 (-),score=56.51 TRINITY_DN2142_c0_g2_i1:155-1018(-)